MFAYGRAGVIRADSPSLYRLRAEPGSLSPLPLPQRRVRSPP
jgi:hypothetical protein